MQCALLCYAIPFVPAAGAAAPSLHPSSKDSCCGFSHCNLINLLSLLWQWKEGLVLDHNIIHSCKALDHCNFRCRALCNLHLWKTLQHGSVWCVLQLVWQGELHKTAWRNTISENHRKGHCKFSYSWSSLLCEKFWFLVRSWEHWEKQRSNILQDFSRS